MFSDATIAARVGSPNVLHSNPFGDPTRAAMQRRVLRCSATCSDVAHRPATLSSIDMSIRMLYSPIFERPFFARAIATVAKH